MSKQKPKNTTKTELSELQARINELEVENAYLREKFETKQLPKKHSWNWLRKSAIVFFVALSVTSIMLFNVSVWLKNTIIDTDTFVSTIQPLLKEDVIQERIQTDITNALFERIDIASELQKVLPENIAFLSVPLADQIESTTSDKIGEALSSDRVYAIWGKSLSGVHDTVISYINNESADGVVTVNEVYDVVSSSISQDSQLGFLTNKQLPDKVGSFTITEFSWLPQARATINTVTYAPLVFLVSSVFSFLMAILLSRNKRRTLLTILVLISVIFFSTLAALTLANWEIGQVAKPQNSTIAQSIYSTITAPLEQRTLGYAAFFVILSIVTLATSSIEWVKTTRRFIDEKFILVANKFLPKKTLPLWMTNTRQHITAIAWALFIGIFLISGFRLPPEYNQLKNGFALSLFALSLLYLMSVFIRSVTRNK